MSVYLHGCTKGTLFPFGDSDLVLVCCAFVSQEIGQGEGEVTVIVCVSLIAELPALPVISRHKLAAYTSGSSCLQRDLLLIRSESEVKLQA